MTKSCANCGTDNQESASYCSNCGAELIEESVEENPEEESNSNQADAEQTKFEENFSQSTPDREPPEQKESLDNRLKSRAEGLSTHQEYLAVACLGVVIGAFLPWFSATVFGTTVTVNGIERDGVFTLLAALLILGFLFKRWTKRTRQVSLVLGILVTGLSLIYISDPWAMSANNPTELQRNAVSVGIGLYLTLLSGIGITAASFLTENPDNESANDKIQNASDNRSETT